MSPILTGPTAIALKSLLGKKYLGAKEIFLFFRQLEEVSFLLATYIFFSFAKKRKGRCGCGLVV